MSSCAISTDILDPAPPVSPFIDLKGGGSFNSVGPKVGSRRYGWSGGKNLCVKEVEIGERVQYVRLSAWVSAWVSE